MDLINRYLQAVKFWLPTKQKRESSQSCRKTSAPRLRIGKPTLGGS